MNNADFLVLIEDFLVVRKLSPTTFGMKYAGDPNFVFDLRKGREVREGKKNKIIKKIKEET